MVRHIIVLLLIFITVPATALADDKDPPSEDATRKQVDALIASFRDGNKKATAGMIEQAIGLSISFGAPTYNRGDHAACARFYSRTAESVVAAFADPNAATPAGRSSLDDLRAALERAKGEKDPDRVAWALRFAFDKNQLACVLQAQRAQGLVAMGEEYFKRSEFAESQDAFESAIVSLHELDGQALDTIPLGCRYATIALANSLFAQQKFSDASKAVVKGLDYVPQWPTVTVDLRSLHRDPAEYEAVLTVLENRVKENPSNPALQFLLGYEYWFTGRRVDAKVAFQHTLKLDPEHAGAKRFIDAAHRGAEGPRA